MDLICFSHLRWNFVYQRPQHLITRFSKKYRTFYFEEPLPSREKDGYDINIAEDGVLVVVPHLEERNNGDVTQRIRNVLDSFIKNEKIGKYILWYYTPMALPHSSH